MSYLKVVAFTHVVYNEALALSKDKASRVGMEGDGQIRGGGEKLEGAAPTNVATQDPSRNLVAVGDGQHVAVADVQSGQEEDRQGQFRMTESDSQSRQWTTVWEMR